MRIPGPSDLVKVAGQSYEAIEQAIALVPKAVGLLGDAATLVQRAGGLVGRVEALLDGVDGTSARAAALVERVEALLPDVEDTAGRAAAMVGALEPSLHTLQPTLETLAESTSPDEVRALVGLVDLLPEITERVRVDILPILGTLGSVAPDLRTLLMISRELNEMLGAIPGLGRAKRKFEDELDDGVLDPDDPAGMPAGASPASTAPSATPAMTTAPMPRSAAERRSAEKS